MPDMPDMPAGACGHDTATAQDWAASSSPETKYKQASEVDMFATRNTNPRDARYYSWLAKDNENTLTGLNIRATLSKDQTGILNRTRIKICKCLKSIKRCLNCNSH
jgi:hypothetical protein